MVSKETMTGGYPLSQTYLFICIMYQLFPNVKAAKAVRYAYRDESLSKQQFVPKFLPFSMMHIAILSTLPP